MHNNIHRERRTQSIAHELLMQRLRKKKKDEEKSQSDLRKKRLSFTTGNKKPVDEGQVTKYKSI